MKIWRRHSTFCFISNSSVSLKLLTFCFSTSLYFCYCCSGYACSFELWAAPECIDLSLYSHLRWISSPFPPLTCQSALLRTHVLLGTVETDWIKSCYCDLTYQIEQVWCLHWYRHWCQEYSLVYLLIFNWIWSFGMRLWKCYLLAFSLLLFSFWRPLIFHLFAFYLVSFEKWNCCYCYLEVGHWFVKMKSILGRTEDSESAKSNLNPNHFSHLWSHPLSFHLHFTQHHLWYAYFEN